MQYYEINEQTARRANDVNSMSDYRPGSATEEYRAAVDKAAALVQARKTKISPYYHDKLDALLDRYTRRLADYYNAYYRNESACPSILVCGGSNFPVRKKQKQNARRESLWQEYKEIDAILDKIRSVGTGAVDLTDPHAREMLQDRLQQEQNALDYCKAANAYYRKHKTLRGYASLTDQQADALTDPDAFSVKLYGKPYGDFELSSLRGKIKRVQARLADLDKLQAAAQQPDNTTKFDGGEIVRNAEENRLQILFDEIPDADTRRRAEIQRFPLVAPQQSMAAPANTKCRIRRPPGAWPVNCAPDNNPKTKNRAAPVHRRGIAWYNRPITKHKTKGCNA